MCDVLNNLWCLPLSVLRPKYVLDRAQVQGAVATIPATQYTRLTGRRYPYPRIGTRAGPEQYTTNPGVLRPHYTLDRAEVQGVMPASTYYALTGKLVTTRGPELPRAPTPTVVRAPALQTEWMLGAGIVGFIIGILTGWGLTEALARAAAVRIYPRR